VANGKGSIRRVLRLHYSCRRDAAIAGEQSPENTYQCAIHSTGVGSSLKGTSTHFSKLINFLIFLISFIKIFSDMARSTRLVILIKNIYTLWGRKRFLLPVTYFPTNLEYPFTLRVAGINIFEKYKLVVFYSYFKTQVFRGPPSTIGTETTFFLSIIQLFYNCKIIKKKSCRSRQNISLSEQERKICNSYRAVRLNHIIINYK